MTWQKLVKITALGWTTISYIKVKVKVQLSCQVLYEVKVKVQLYCQVQLVELDNQYGI